MGGAIQQIRSPAGAAMWLVVVLGSGGCARLPTVPTHPSDDEFSRPQEVTPEGMSDDGPVALSLQPGDVITIRAYSDEAREYTGLLVDERGVVHVPLAGAIEVGGIPLSEAEERVQEELRRYDRVVRVNLLVEEATGHRASVLGAVDEPGRVEVLPGMRLADLLAAVGGPILDTETGEVVVMADLDGARLVRGGEALPVSVRMALEGQPRHNVRVRPGDHLYVPGMRGRNITVLGEVDDPGIVAFRRDLRLTQALASADGLTSEGDRTDIHVVRGSLSSPKAYRAKLKDIVNGKRPDVVLAPGDIVYVTQEWTANVGEVLDRLSPLLTTGTTLGFTYWITQ
ncbi:MAG: SLBB domain-containing protein [Myxococcota bacterium]